MTDRLQAELQRLYGASSTAGPKPELLDAAGRTRALVLEVRQPAEWSVTAAVWQGVQADLNLPAPAIAVSGTNGYQLWFSLAEPVSLAEGTGFLRSLQERYLAHQQAGQVGHWPMPSLPPLEHQPIHTSLPPAPQTGADRWSAFVAPGLAELFADDPWLDLPPSPDAQADLLCSLDTIDPADFCRVLGAQAPEEGTTTAHRQSADPGPAPEHSPQAFLLAVMNDASVDMALRLEAAKALLPYTSPRLR